MIESVCICELSAINKSQGGLQVLKEIAPALRALGDGQGKSRS